MFEFFNIPHTFEKRVADKNNIDKTIEIANALPTFEKFAVIIGVCTDTLMQWCREYPEFLDTYKKCQALQKDMLNDLALRGFYNATYTAFAAKNLTDMCKESVVNSSNELRDAYLKAMSDLTNDKMGEQ